MPALPRYRNLFVGRQGDVDALRRLLLQPSTRIVTLCGPGGVGKTRLAVETAASLAPPAGESPQEEAFADGVCFVSLAPVSSAEHVPAAMAQALGIPPQAGLDRIEALSAYLREKQMLIVLDNFEHVRAAAQYLRPLPAGGGTKLLVTSCAPLGLPEERVYHVRPLAVHEPHKRDAPAAPHALRSSPPVTLFIERVQRSDPAFEPDAHEVEQVARICALVDGLPLAIELAASWARTFSPAEILDTLERCGAARVLRSLRPTRQASPAGEAHDTRHQSLTAVLNWSYHLLDPTEQALLRLLSVFGGSFSLADVTALAGAVPACGIDPTEVPILIAALVDRSLVVAADARDQATSGHRFALLQTVRDYARTQLRACDAGDEEDRLYDAHAQHFLAFARRAEPELSGPKQAKWLDAIDAAYDNIRAALSWLLCRDPLAALHMATSIWRFWETRGDVAEGRWWLESALAANSDAPEADRAAALAGAGSMAWREADYAAATRFHEQSLALYERIQDKAGIALALNNLGVQAQNQHAAERAQHLYERSLAVAHQAGDHSTAIMALVNLGVLALEGRRLDEARQRLTASVELCQRAGHTRYLVAALHNLGEVLLAQGDPRGAVALQRQSLTWARDLGARPVIAACLEEIAGIWTAQHEAAHAARLLGAAEGLRERLGIPISPNFRAEYVAPCIERLQAELGVVKCARAWAEGRALTMDQAIAYALAGPEAHGAHPGTLETGQHAPRRSVPRGTPGGPAAQDALSARERTVAALVARGLSNREIATALTITEGTAANHVAHILQKLAFHSRAQIAAWFARQSAGQSAGQSASQRGDSRGNGAVKRGATRQGYAERR